LLFLLSTVKIGLTMKAAKWVVILGLALVAINAAAVTLFFTPDSTSIQVVGTNVIFSTSFLSTIGRAYEIQVQTSDSPDVNSSNWVNQSGSQLGNGGTVTWSYTNVGGAMQPQQYYRLRVGYTFP